MKREVDFWHYYSTLFFIGVNRFSIQIWKCQFLFKGEARSVRACVAHKWFVFVIVAVARTDDKQMI